MERQQRSRVRPPSSEGPARIRILIVGKDARTDALAAVCNASDSAPELFAFSEFAIPGLLDKCVDGIWGRPLQVPEIAAYASAVDPHLVIIGPEEPLERGLVDTLEELGYLCFGPTQQLARIESSKSWTRRLLDGHGIAGNPQYRIFEDSDGLGKYMAELGDFVVKPDGLTGGKGVKVFGEHLGSLSEAYDYAVTLLGHPPGRVVIEERLDGEEFSLQTITDGESVVHCPLVQDHKRAEDEDKGPNTGGMGSYSCSDWSLPFLGSNDVAQAQRITERVIEALNRETGRPYRGVLYGGFMATADGVRLIEYNSRFGDPEAMNVLSLLTTDFVDLAMAVAKGHLARVKVTFEPKASVCKYIVPEKYPYGQGDGDQISVPDEMLARSDIRCYWAATNRVDSKLLLTGSRAVAFVGIGDTLSEAEQLAQQGVQSVSGPVRYRSDIGTTSLINKRVEHMMRLRATGTGS